MSDDKKLSIIEVPEDHKILEDHVKKGVGVLALTLNRVFSKFSEQKSIDLLIMEASLALAMANEVKNRLSSRGVQLVNGISTMLLMNVKRDPSKEESRLIVLPGIFKNKKGLS